MNGGNLICLITIMVFDPTYVLVLIGAVICLIASARVKSTFNKYSRYRSMSGMTGAQAAERILNSAGISDVDGLPYIGKSDRSLQSVQKRH